MNVAHLCIISMVYLIQIDVKTNGAVGDIE